MASSRADGRGPDDLRPVTIRRGYTKNATASVLIEVGDTRVLSTVQAEDKVPPFLTNSGQGWVTAEYGMLPGSTTQRVPRDRGGRVDGRSVEIQRLIGRALRAVVDRTKMPNLTLWVDCDVLQADGGTRTAAITGAWVALVDAVEKLRTAGKLAASPITGGIAAVSVGVVRGEPMLDLCYAEDSECDVDMNVVMTTAGDLVEVQGSAERAAFNRVALDLMLGLAEGGIRRLHLLQAAALAGPASPGT